MKTALVTGGTSGIGAGAVRTLLAAGWRVIATGASEAETTSFREESLDEPAAASLEVCALDVTDGDAVSSLVNALDALEGLVNCAGVLYRGEEYDIDVFQKVVDVNLTGTMRVCCAAHPLLTSSGGAIVNTASMLSFFGGPGFAHAACKSTALSCTAPGPSPSGCEPVLLRHRRQPPSSVQAPPGSR